MKTKLPCPDCGTNLSHLLGSPENAVHHGRDDDATCPKCGSIWQTEVKDVWAIQKLWSKKPVYRMFLKRSYKMNQRPTEEVWRRAIATLDDIDDPVLDDLVEWVEGRSNPPSKEDFEQAIALMIKRCNELDAIEDNPKTSLEEARKGRDVWGEYRALTHLVAYIKGITGLTSDNSIASAKL